MAIFGSRVITEFGNAFICNVFTEQVWVFSLHLVLALPGELGSALSTPSHFHNGNPTLLQSLDFPIHDLHRLFYEVEFLINLDFLQRDDKRFVREALLEV
ncbi:hypothetical protein LXL04_037401 [Taraxacum kok-saghyz]